MSLVEGLLTALVPLGAALFGWWLAQRTMRRERKAAWDDQLRVRKSQVLADTATIVEAHDLGAGTLKELWDRSTKRRRRDYLDRWRAQIRPVEREARALALLERDEDVQALAVEMAQRLWTLVLVLDMAIDEYERELFNLEWVDAQVQATRKALGVLTSRWQKDLVS